MTENPIWERLLSDTDKSYEAFCIYRDMGANRSLAKTTTKYYGKDTASIRQVEKWSSGHDWINRVRAYDTEQRRLQQQRNHQKRLEIESDALADYDMIRRAINKRVTTLEAVDYIMPPSDLRDLINLMQQANAYARLNSGLPDKIASNKNEHTGADGKAIEVRSLPPLPDRILNKIVDPDENG